MFSSKAYGYAVEVAQAPYGRFSKKASGKTRFLPLEWYFLIGINMS